MATSGSYNYSLTRNSLILRSFQKAGITGENEVSLSPNRLAIGVDLLNGLIKKWQKDDINLWALKEGTVFTAHQDYDYSLGSSGDHATLSYNQTTLSADEASGQTVLSVTSSSGMTAGDYVGIKLTAGTRQWTTISTVDSSTQITVATALTGAAASGNTVVTYTTKIDRPLDILSLRSKLLTEDTETPATQVDYISFQEIYDKTVDAGDIITEYNYNPTLTTGTLRVWPRPENVDLVLNISFQQSLADMDSATDDFDFPTEYTLPIMICLAKEVASFYNMEPIIPKLEKEAAVAYIEVKNSSADRSDVFITPDCGHN